MLKRKGKVQIEEKLQIIFSQSLATLPAYLWKEN
jgi:hypothetical protein